MVTGSSLSSRANAALTVTHLLRTSDRNQDAVWSGDLLLTLHTSEKNQDAHAYQMPGDS